MRVVLVNLPWEVRGRFGVRAGSRWPFTAPPVPKGHLPYIPFPFFLATAAAVLKKDGVEVLLLDSIAQELNINETIEKIKFFSPTLIVVETSTPSFDNDLFLIKKMKECLVPGSVALVGPHATVFSQQILEHYPVIDYVFRGEYEGTLLDLVRHLATGSKLSQVRGLSYRESGQVLENPRRLSIEPLDELPWPERASLPLERYHDGFCQMPFPSVQMLSSRGCPFACTFCLWPQVIYNERRIRLRNPRAVVDEMEYLVKEYHFKAVYFDDDCFNVDKNHVLGIAGEIKKRKLSVPWSAMARADLMDEGTLDVLAGSGFYAVKYGVESVSQAVLEGIKKNIDLKKTRQMIQATKDQGIKVHLTFCLGLLGETKETIRAMKSFIQELKPDSCQFSYATPFPGTEYFRQVEERGELLSEEWSDYDGNVKCIVKTGELSACDLEEAKKDLELLFKVGE
jgi:radical SAM superfamily enzyme YgiQ (UPF0313 family)